MFYILWTVYFNFLIKYYSLLIKIYRYRLADQGDSDWRTIRVYPDGATTFTVYNLQADTEYDFQVLSRNKLGDGMFSPIIRAKTKCKYFLF